MYTCSHSNECVDRILEGLDLLIFLRSILKLFGGGGGVI